jgi:hypothetical protein
MVQEANLALIETRASVNKTDLHIETVDTLGGSFIGRRRVRGSSQSKRETHSSGSINAGIDEQNDEESKAEGRSDSQSPSLRDSLQQSRTGTSARHWNIAREIANDNRQHNVASGRRAKLHRMPSGRWHFDFGDSSFVRRLRKFADQPPIFSPGLEKPKKEGNLVSSLVDQYTYAVVTFTSRQAAISARQCMADGSGLGRWEEVEHIPIPPLADSPPWDICLCRACCKLGQPLETCFRLCKNSHKCVSRPPRDIHYQR